MTTRASLLLMGVLSLAAPMAASAQNPGSDLTPIAPVPPTDYPTELPSIRLGGPMDSKPAPAAPTVMPALPALDKVPTGMPPTPPSLVERPQNGDREETTHRVLMPSARSADIAASPAAAEPMCGTTCAQGCPGCRVWGQAEYLLWWVKGASLPPLVSTSTSQASLGRLDRPDTTVLFGGDRDGEVRHGGRFALGWQTPLDDCCHEWVGVDAGYFFLNNQNNGFSAYSMGDVVLARPFTDAITGAQRIQQVANLRIGNAGAIPPDIPALVGGIAVNNPSRFWGIEGNANLHCRLNNCPIEFFGGYRYLSLSEGLSVREDLFQPADPTGIPDNTRFLVYDSFGAANRFNGGQVGLRTETRSGRWGMQFVGKLGLGSNHQTVDIAGFTTSTVIGSPSATGVGGLLALPTNIGHYERERVCFVPEVGLNATYEVSRHVRCFLGYTFLYWSSVVRPGDQIDVHVNTAYLPPAAPTTGPARPAFNWNATDFWAQGVNFGLELNF